MKRGQPVTDKLEHGYVEPVRHFPDHTLIWNSIRVPLNHLQVDHLLRQAVTGWSGRPLPRGELDQQQR